MRFSNASRRDVCVLKTTTVLLCLQQTSFASTHPHSPYDPDGYFYERYLAEEAEAREEFRMGKHAIRQEDVTIDAIPYVKYSIGDQALYLQKIFSSAHDGNGEIAMVDCTRETGGDHTFSKLHRIRLETKIKDSIRLDLTMMNQIIVSACTGQPIRYNTNTEPLTIGFSWTGDDGKIYRIFNQGFGLNIGIAVFF